MRRVLYSLVILAVMTPIASMQNNIPAKQTRSEVSASEIDSLSSRVSSRKSAADFWSHWYIRLVFGTAIAGLATFIATWALSNSQRLLSAAQDDLIKAKDRQLSSDLRDKDLKISQLNKEAEGIKSAAAKAKEESDRNIAELNRQTTSLENANLRVRSDLAEANTTLEAEKQKRLKLAASLLPRSFVDQSEAVLKLSSFSPLQVVFAFVSEREPRVLAEELNGVFNMLRWKSYRVKDEPDDFIKDGVTISPGGSAVGTTDWQQQSEARSNTANVVEKLRGLLEKAGIETNVGGIEWRLPPTALIIRIGLKPNRELEQSLKELSGVQTASPVHIPSLPNIEHITISGMRVSIPDGPPLNNPAKTP